MGLVIGPSKSHSSFANYVNVDSSTVLGTSVGGGRLYCKSGGTAWIVALNATQVTMQWAGGQYNSTSVGNKCCISEWSALSTALTNAGLTPSQWFVPSCTQLQSAIGCRNYWDSFDNFSNYWSSTELNNTGAMAGYTFGDGSIAGLYSKSTNIRVRAIRCVTY
jgi:hypothetical protein